MPWKRLYLVSRGRRGRRSGTRRPGTGRRPSASPGLVLAASHAVAASPGRGSRNRRGDTGRRWRRRWSATPRRWSRRGRCRCPPGSRRRQVEAAGGASRRRRRGAASCPGRTRTLGGDVEGVGDQPPRQGSSVPARFASCSGLRADVELAGAARVGRGAVDRDRDVVVVVDEVGQLADVLTSIGRRSTWERLFGTRWSPVARGVADVVAAGDRGARVMVRSQELRVNEGAKPAKNHSLSFMIGPPISPPKSPRFQSHCGR